MFRPRAVLAICAVVALAVAAYAVLAPSGLPRLRGLEAERAALQGEVDAARTENERRAREVKVLQGGEPASRAVLEKAAREELGWARPDEVVFTGLPSSSPPATTTAPAPAPAPVAAAPAPAAAPAAAPGAGAPEAAR